MRRLLIYVGLWLGCVPNLHAQPAGKPALPKESKLDALGDPLPAGIAIRLGTTRLRHANANGISAIAWAPDGKLLASGGHDEFIRLWDPNTGKEVRHMKAGSAITGLAFLKSGKTLVSADLRDVRAWDAETGREIRQFGASKAIITGLARIIHQCSQKGSWRNRGGSRHEGLGKREPVKTPPPYPHEKSNSPVATMWMEWASKGAWQESDKPF